MYNYKQTILSLFLVVSSTVISSCDSSNTADNPTPETIPNSKINPSPPKKPQKSPTPKVELYSNNKAISGKTTNVTVYTSDAQCQELIPQKADVSAAAPMNEAIGKIFKEQSTADFSVSGYRINVKNGVAIVDLRISPDSKRQVSSLSSCEQFALFSSVRKTLISNSQWKIKDVRFTERGEDITL
ncbi:sporulation/spore germination protein [Aphanizomenon sp. CS-733/32]|uniref:sporulation/spore germination protein n=1 Tax=Aphanizomenon sp. CS-733/32 TaxID=3021715 RepID=UPI00232DAA1C|nr:sporulation/spore germination protein [Aphanizomenon sp. CS-733/32]MDB9310402.1 sporulation/spore germination protein [Aphanizomenon sp. CS-733/32]